MPTLFGDQQSFQKPEKPHANADPNQLPELMNKLASISLQTRLLIEWSLHTLVRQAKRQVPVG